MAQYNLYNRSQRRLPGEDAFGRKIVISNTDHVSTGVRGRSGSNGSRDHAHFNSRYSQGSSRGDWRAAANRTADTTAVSDQNTSLQSVTPYPIKLLITNLDSSIRDLRSTLNQLLNKYISSFNVTISYQEGKVTATVQVANQQDAEYVISKLHHQKLGFRRISISYSMHRVTNPEELKERVVYLLQNATMKSMPLYMLINQLEERYLMRVSMSEVAKLSDICEIVEDKGERLVSLTAEMRASPIQLQKPQLIQFCYLHCPLDAEYQAEFRNHFDLPNVKMRLKELDHKLNTLLKSHMGILPLLSFGYCYEHEFGEPLPLDNNEGVPLEHLVTCISNVKLKYGDSNSKVKYIVWEPNKPEDTDPFAKSPYPVAVNISLLRRELIDLLKNSPKSQIPLSKCVPAYHHHFGKQLRVADYGFTKLDDLLYSPYLLSVVQILGEGPNRILTFTHNTQLRRFTSILLRLLKKQPLKQIALTELPEIYERAAHKPFSAVEFGLCSIEDLLEEVPDNVLVLSRDGSNLTISIPQRDRTVEEIARTKKFADEVVKLLSHAPNYSMLFEKFVPHYHHHFGYQCKVSTYGFTKLIELFEAIPEIVDIEELPNGQRQITLTAEQIVNLIGQRILDLINKSSDGYLPVNDLRHAYEFEYKTPLNLHGCGSTDVHSLMKKLSTYVTIVGGNGPIIVPTKSLLHSPMSLRVWSLLVKPPHQCEANALLYKYYQQFKTTITITQIEELSTVIVTRTSTSEQIVFLIPEFVQAARVYDMLVARGSMDFADLKTSYLDKYGEVLSTSNSSFYLVINHGEESTSVTLNSNLLKFGLPLSKSYDLAGDEAFKWPPPPGLDLSPYYWSATVKRTPPKPDTPPSLNLSFRAWQPQTPGGGIDEESDFFVSLPKPETPKNLPNPYTLISPAKFLLPAHPLGTIISAFTPPEPNELPAPEKLLKDGVASDESTDSGVNNSHLISENEMDTTEELNVQAAETIKRQSIFN